MGGCSVDEDENEVPTMHYADAVRQAAKVARTLYDVDTHTNFLKMFRLYFQVCHVRPRTCRVPIGSTYLLMCLHPLHHLALLHTS